MKLELIAKRYGALRLEPHPIRGECSSIDLRVMTGAAPGTPDETCVVPPGVFARSLFPPKPGAYPVGEIRICLAGRDVRLVADATQRAGVIELTLAHLAAAESDPVYADQLQRWLTGESQR